jgi:hypothetical protein
MESLEFQASSPLTKEKSMKKSFRIVLMLEIFLTSACLVPNNGSQDPQQQRSERRLGHGLGDQGSMLFRIYSSPDSNPVIIKFPLSESEEGMEYVDGWGGVFDPALEEFGPLTCDTDSRFIDIKEELKILELCEIKTLYSGPEITCALIWIWREFGFFDQHHNDLEIYLPTECDLNEGINLNTYFCQEESEAFASLTTELKEIATDCYNEAD